MITRLRVINFQCCELFDEELAPGINCFVGKSGAGKSARAIRSLRWLALNRPLGESYIFDPAIINKSGSKFDTGPTEVRAWTDDGHEVARIKTDKDNLYILNGEEYRAFGQNPPEAITAALNIGPSNFSLQHVGPYTPPECRQLYLLSMTPTEVASTLNKIAGMDLIDDTRGKLNSRYFTEHQESNTQKVIKENLEAELEQYAGLDALELAFQKAGQLELNASTKWTEAIALQNQADRVRESKSILDQYAGLDKLMAGYNKANVLQTKAADCAQKSIELRRVAEAVRSSEIELDKYGWLYDLKEAYAQASVKQIKSAELTSKATDIRKAAKAVLETKAELTLYSGFQPLQSIIKLWVGKYPSIEEKRSLAGDLKVRAANIRKAQGDMLDLQTKLAKAEKEFHELMPDICPLCGKGK